MHALAILILVGLVVYSLYINTIGSWLNKRADIKQEEKKHQEWLSYKSPQEQEQDKMSRRYRERRNKAKKVRYSTYQVEMERGYRWQKYTENKSYYNWEEEQTNINGREWDWKLTEEWEAECKSHHEKWGTTP